MVVGTRAKLHQRQTKAPTTVVELAESAATNCDTWVGDHDVLLGILLGPFEGNWFKAKACLTMGEWPTSCTTVPSHDIGITLMQGLVAMRTAKWTTFVKDVVKPGFKERMTTFGAVTGPLVDKPKTGSADAPASHSLADGELTGDIDLQGDIDAQTKGEKNFQDIFDSVGAAAVTSDVDLSTGGSNSELGVQFVNWSFRNKFAPGRVIPYDPGTVFDINVYASDWIHGEAESSDSNGVRTITPAQEITGMTATDQAARTEKMEIWSLVKVRRNLSDDQWDAYCNLTLANLPDHEEEAKNELQERLVRANSEYYKFKAKVEARQKEMQGELDEQESLFLNNRPSAFHQDFADEAHFTRAANSIYEDTLQEVKVLRVRIERLQVNAVQNAEAISNLGVLLGDKIAEALTYANEVYATEGAVQHTVLKQGAGKKLEKLKAKPATAHLTGLDYNLTPELYLQAVNENVGDSLHSIDHYRDTPRYAVYRAGKYLARLIDATTLLLGEGKAASVPHFASLAEIGSESVRVKGTKKGDIEGDPQFVEDDDFFKKYKGADLDTVLADIIEFGAMIPKLFDDKKRAEQAVQQASAEQARLAASTKSAAAP